MVCSYRVTLTRILFGRLNPFADRLRYLGSLAHSDPDMPLAIADDDERAEVETPAALDHFGDAVNISTRSSSSKSSALRRQS